MNDSSTPESIDTFGASRRGRGRDVSTDQFVVAALKRAAQVYHASKPQLDHHRRFGDNQAHLLLVADGLSGHPGARSASSIVVEEVMDSVLNAVPWVPELDLDSEAVLRRELKDTVARCNEHISDAAAQTGDRADMASTITLAFVRWPFAFVVHAGDGRAYHIHADGMECLTTDHTVASRMVEAGEIEPAAARVSPFAKMLWNAVGGDSSVSPELTTTRLRVGDSLLLCTDGLTRGLSDRAIEHVVKTADSAKGACEELLSAATCIGVEDDTTVAMARFGADLEVPVKVVEDPAPSVGRGLARPLRSEGVSFADYLSGC